MNRLKQISGFTFIELIVVIIIFSILFSFSIPLFNDIQLFGQAKGRAGEIARLADSLKKRAVEHNSDYLLHLDRAGERLWVTSEDMNEEDRQKAKEKGSMISGKTRIVSVQFAGVKKQDVDEYLIRFRKQGYSDFVFVHIVEDNIKLTLRIDPFLPQTNILDGHVDFEECI